MTDWHAGCCSVGHAEQRGELQEDVDQWLGVLQANVEGLKQHAGDQAVTAGA